MPGAASAARPFPRTRNPLGYWLARGLQPPGAVSFARCTVLGLGLLLGCGASLGPESAPDAGGSDADDAASSRDSGPQVEEDAGGDDVDDASVVSVSFPATIACGEVATATVRMQNSGTTTWTRELGYKLGAVGDEDPLVAGDVRVWLDEGVTVAPGQEHEFSVSLVAPEAAGEHLSDWQMVREGVAWFGGQAAAQVRVECEDIEYSLPLPDMSGVVDDVAAERPDLLANSCQDTGGTWEFMDLVVDRLREHDERWGYNWKRGVVGDPSEDVVDYHYGPGAHEGSTEVYIIDVIGGHCGDRPSAAWIDVTQATADGGTIGMWTGRGRF